MVARIPRSLRVCMVLAFLLAVPILLVSLPLKSTSNASCEALRVWAQSYAHQVVTLDQVAAFDRPHRLAIFDAVTPSVRALLWQEQFRRLARQSDWTPQQHAAIVQTAAYLTPALYAQQQATRSPFMRAQWARIAPLFPLPPQRRGFFQLGAVVASEPASAASFYDRLARPFRAHAMAQTTWCECSTSYGNVECYPGGCGSGFCKGWSGCGFSGTEPCVGMCSF